MFRYSRFKQNVKLPRSYSTSCPRSVQLTWFTNPRMHLFHIPQCSIQNRNVYISVLNGALWDMEQVQSGICEIGPLLLNVEMISPWVLTHSVWDKMATISQTTFSEAFSWMKTYELRLRFHWWWFCNALAAMVFAYFSLKNITDLAPKG